MLVNIADVYASQLQKAKRDEDSYWYIIWLDFRFKLLNSAYHSRLAVRMLTYLIWNCKVEHF